MRLQNVSKVGKYEYRVVLDDEKESVNYIERTTGIYYDVDAGQHRCLKCLRVPIWINWRGDDYASEVCACGQMHTIRIISMGNTAHVMD